MYIKKLLKTEKTVFLTNDLRNLFEVESKNYLYVLLNRMVKRNELKRLARGVYTYSENFNKFELANKLKRPSYVSLETILYSEGIVFQTYENTITSVSDETSEKTVDKTNYTYQQIKDEILLNPLGIINDGIKISASPERAVCDRLYLTPNYYFDNPDKLNKEKIIEIVKIYPKRVQKEVQNLF